MAVEQPYSIMLLQLETFQELLEYSSTVVYDLHAQEQNKVMIQDRQLVSQRQMSLNLENMGPYKLCKVIDGA